MSPPIVWSPSTRRATSPSPRAASTSSTGSSPASAEDEVEALGDNVVLILETVKEMTQPEIMAVVYRMIEAVQRQQRHMEDEPDEAPSLFQLARQMRDPEIRKGMGRALNTLRAVSEVETGPPRKFVVTHNQKPRPRDAGEK